MFYVFVGGDYVILTVPAGACPYRPGGKGQQKTLAEQARVCRSKKMKNLSPEIVTHSGRE